jgi:hypothetical protein
MEHPEPDPYAPETLLRRAATQNAELRELLAALAADLERLACEPPEHAERFLARAMRLRKRLWEVVGRG